MSQSVRIPSLAPAARTPRRLRLSMGREDWIMAGGILAVGAFLVVAVALPLLALFVKAFENRAGEFVGLANFAAYFSTPSLTQSIWNSLFVASASTVITVTLGFVFAYGLTRTCMPLRGVLKAMAITPILSPSMLPAISLVYLFGNKGFAKGLLFGNSIYGPIGIIMGEVYYTFPHVLLILVTALSMADARLYEAADALGTSRWRTFWTVTLPGVRYGLVSAAVVAFTLALTDFGVAKVVGGRFNVLATDVYKQVIGQKNFPMGAVVGLVLLMPALLSFLVTRHVQKRQKAQLSARSVLLAPQPQKGRDLVFFALCSVIALAIATMLGTSAFASFIKLWPYDLTLSLSNYDFSLVDSSGWTSYTNSLVMASSVAVIGTAVVFGGAYLVEKGRSLPLLRHAIGVLALLPLAVPGLVLGIAYIFFFNHPANPLGFLMGTMAILVINTLAHYYTVAHLSASTILKQVDGEYEAVSASLKVPFWRTFVLVTVPVCLPTILDIFVYLFATALTTASSLIFLYTPDTKTASVAVISIDDAGNIASAAAMAMVIVYTSAAVRGIDLLVRRFGLARFQRWRRR
ncbi:putative 2-aminoethylphosphonate ABC transporter permease subunit [Azospirillum sp.]|uniref:putative 2-aminoethylphosphonate ABC transporter permease subunit n=1 Tax=Azospirillum sp. TaxID=34012 RepID=UPI003D7392C1